MKWWFVGYSPEWVVYYLEIVYYDTVNAVFDVADDFIVAS